MNRRLSAAAVAVALTAISAITALPSAASDPHLPDTYVVSEEPGFQPEGIEVTPNGTIYVSSFGNGDVLRGHVTSTRFERFASGAAAGRAQALGLHADSHGRLYVAGKTQLDVYSADGSLLTTLRPESGPVGEPYLNDLVITPHAVYVTDSTNAVVWRATLGDDVGALERWFDARTVVPGFPPEFMYLNGIDASEDGQTLLVSSQGLEALIRIDVAGRSGELVDMGGHSFGPDGIELRGSTLYAVLNYAAPGGAQGVYVAELDETLRHGQVIASAAEGFATPTTLAVTRGRVLVVNSQIDDGAGTPPYTISAVDDPIAD